MNMNKLFNALPRDLQWEVLTVFVGSHVVRKGKLMRKIAVDERHQMIQNMVRIQKTNFATSLNYYEQSFVQFSDGARLMFCHDPNFGGIGYMFVSSIKADFTWMPAYFSGRRWTPIDMWTGIASPFVKHVYPSYEHTDKKKKVSQL